MFTQAHLQELYDSNSFIVQETELWSLIKHSPTRDSWEAEKKYFTVYTEVFNTYSEFVDSLMWWCIWNKPEVVYIEQEERKDKLINWQLT